MSGNADELAERLLIAASKRDERLPMPLELRQIRRRAEEARIAAQYHLVRLTPDQADRETLLAEVDRLTQALTLAEDLAAAIRARSGR
ncbi:MAG TPA: hypothetical protein VFP50_15480 [Anaeromyxobacteraceae bacterium]|nr:hypothetical protein [Anaeromyxobacteraceae bacterium]